jgi:hypothetical protein
MNEELFDKVMDNIELTQEEVIFVEGLKKEEITEEEQELFQLFQEQDDNILDFNPTYFKDIHEKNKVLTKIRFKEMNE